MSVNSRGAVITSSHKCSLRSNARTTYRLEIFAIRFHYFNPLLIAKYHFGVFEKIFSDDKQLGSTVDIALGKRLLVDLGSAQGLSAEGDRQWDFSILENHWRIKNSHLP